MRLLPDVATALSRLRDGGFELVVASNQSAVARGLATPAEVSAIQERIAEILAAEGASIDAWYYCFHHPESPIEEWRSVCGCRKPEPGMILRAAAERDIDLGESYLVGNMWSDIVAARRAGVRGILLETTPAKTAGDPYSVAAEARPWARASSLAEAADSILDWAGSVTSREHPEEGDHRR